MFILSGGLLAQGTILLILGLGLSNGGALCKTCIERILYTSAKRTGKQLLSVVLGLSFSAPLLKHTNTPTHGPVYTGTHALSWYTYVCVCQQFLSMGPFPSSPAPTHIHTPNHTFHIHIKKTSQIHIA